MAEITHEDLQELAMIIVKKLQEEFRIKHLSGNLVNTIQIVNLQDRVQVIIPAQTYNMLLFQTKGVVVHTSHGSYASKLDKEGSSFMTYPNGSRKGSRRIKPGNHQGYVDKIVDEAVNEWMKKDGTFDTKKVTEIAAGE